jgi:predicted dehydrogenase
MKKITNRRNFLQGVAGATAFTIVAPHVLGGPKFVAPSDRVNVALVGAGGRGFENVRDLLKLDDVRITTIVDPAEQWDMSKFYYRIPSGRLPVAAEIEKHYAAKDGSFKCALFEDFRKMLTDAKDVDAVLCATPDHLHATISVASMRAGKHVYCEKPLTHNIAEARLVAKVAKETGLATQMGNQGHSADSIREAIEWMHSGALGEIERVHAWVPAYRWNPQYSTLPSEVQPVPKGLNWDLWCGPRKPPEFNNAYAPVSWRDFWMFGCGALGDFGCHDMDSAVWGLDLGQPSEVEFYGAGKVDKNTAPYGENGYFRFAREKKPDLTINWYSGGLRPQIPGVMPDGVVIPPRGTLFEGTKGVMLCAGPGAKPVVYPESVAAQVPKQTMPRSAGHHRDWIDAIKGGNPASSNFEYGARLTETTLLGLLALRAGTPIVWDAENMKVVGGNEATEQIIHGEYRDGWKLFG